MNRYIFTVFLIFAASLATRSRGDSNTTIGNTLPQSAGHYTCTYHLPQNHAPLVADLHTLKNTAHTAKMYTHRHNLSGSGTGKKNTQEAYVKKARHV